MPALASSCVGIFILIILSMIVGGVFIFHRTVLEQVFKKI